MTFANRITRAPRAFEPDRGDEALANLPAVPGEVAALIRGAAGCSPFLGGLIAREAEWLAGALETAPEVTRAALLEETRGLERDPAKGLRRLKRRVALLTALADLGGVWKLEETTAALTDFADAATDRAIRSTIAQVIARGKLPGLSAEAPGDGTGGLVALAMGKMGAHELK